MKTTVELPDELYRRAKAEAALRGRKLKDLIEEGLRLVLDEPRPKSRRPSLAELMEDARGVVDSGVPDLGTNPRHLADFGRDERRHLARDALAALCRRHRIRRLSLFGSVLKGTALQGSDVDLLVEFERGAAPSLFDIADIERELSDLLGGRRVDVRTPEDLSRYFRDEVVREAAVQYESA